MYQRLSNEFFPDSNFRSNTRPKQDMARASFDREYIRRLQNRDPETERHFVDYFGKLLRIKLYARLRNAQMVEDLTQETFLRVLTALRREDGIQSPAALGAYVNSICNNLLFELNRGKSRADCVSIDGFDPPDKGVSAESAMVSEESKELVRRTLEELPSKDRQLLRMVFYEDTDRGDICRTFRISPDYLRVLVHRAKARFREYWLERHGEAFPAGAITGESVQETAGV
jgi:RNA polymerase sigma-70 factor (ECF subfamily)